MTKKPNNGSGSNEGFRDSKGRYRGGHSGNPKGRPPKLKRTFSNAQLRADILYTMEEEWPVTADGKRQHMPSILYVYKQLLRKAAAGDVRCMFKTIDLREQLLAGHMSEQKDLAELAARAQRAYRVRPQDFTDEDLETLRDIGRRLKDPYQLDWPPNTKRPRH